jgi:hypothetical protein
MSHKILVAGQGRAGSSVTWMISHEILLCNGVEADRSWLFEEAFASEHHVMKWHSYRKDIHHWADVIITTKRDLREAVDSYERKLPNRVTDLKSLRIATDEMIKLHNDWEDHSDYEMVYERFRADPEGIVGEIAGVMGMECDPKEIMNKVGHPPAKKPWFIPQGFVDVIEEEYEWWLLKHGYLPENRGDA